MKMVINGFEIKPFADLSDANLSDANLMGANLMGADLSDANLSDANLADADLSGADLRGADLTAAVLYDTDLTAANLMGANLMGAYLTGTDLTSANLPYPIIQMGPGGSRKDYVVFKTGIDEVMTGCFRGSLEEFTKRVYDTYPDGPYRRWYDAVITVFKSMK